MIRTRRECLQAAAVWLAVPCLRAARKDFWESKDAAGWSSQEKQILLAQSPWAQQGFARMEENRPAAGNGNPAGQSVDLPDTRPGVPAGGVKSYPIGQPVPPPPPKPGGQPVQFRVLARWETALPVRLAGAPEIPQVAGEFYVIRLRGLPLMPASKEKPGEPAPADPNEGMLREIEEGTRLERMGKAAIPCTHLFKGSGSASSDVLLFFPRTPDPITMADRVVTVESRFSVFHLSIKFPVRDMFYKGALAL